VVDQLAVLDDASARKKVAAMQKLALFGIPGLGNDLASAAALLLLGVPLASTFVGNRMGRSIAENTRQPLPTSEDLRRMSEINALKDYTEEVKERTKLNKLKREYTKAKTRPLF